MSLFLLAPKVFGCGGAGKVQERNVLSLYLQAVPAKWTAACIPLSALACSVTDFCIFSFPSSLGRHGHPMCTVSPQLTDGRKFGCTTFCDMFSVSGTASLFPGSFHRPGSPHF